ncbi:DUF2024 family protein [Aquimarina sp. MMG015]|uniref:DUF2024 family protein n=1 Tax=Aquimarina TaxID=290174 RepID=UPI0004171DFB|nr:MULTISPECIES: DUF2024 family protein [Aquimarina]AXT58448.1 DUF2024 family protein [Aquimarina sp. AD1]MBQ4805706.1 DUF2024 family protein [Aquimarina sp. MMG015]RKN16804.1 DUF2024 family protein [Aquimarina sp. AD1]
MKIAVWDTYVNRKDGLLMHFDILVSNESMDEDQVLAYGKKYLSTKTFKTLSLTAKECRFCHIETASPEIVNLIETKGYAIIEMENCN